MTMKLFEAEMVLPHTSHALEYETVCSQNKMFVELLVLFGGGNQFL